VRQDDPCRLVEGGSRVATASDPQAGSRALTLASEAASRAS